MCLFWLQKSCAGGAGTTCSEPRWIRGLVSRVRSTDKQISFSVYEIIRVRGVAAVGGDRVSFSTKEGTIYWRESGRSLTAIVTPP